MLKKIFCEAKIKITISPEGALLIKAGSATVTGPDMTFVKSYKNGQPNPFLPGTSLKGVFRSHAEKIIRTLSEKSSVCLPYSNEGDEKFCGDFFKRKDKDEIKNTDVYKYSCPACKTFGSTYFKGRLSISDAYSKEKVNTEDRDGIAIDRYTGGTAHGAKFDLEVITTGHFEAEIHIRNFEIWQLGLIGFVIKDLNDGLLRIGFGTSRGLGKVDLKINDFIVTYYGDKKDKFLDIGDLSSNEEQKAYTFFKANKDISLPESKDSIEGRHTYSLNSETYEKIFSEGAKALNAYLKTLNWLSDIREYSKV